MKLIHLGVCALFPAVAFPAEGNLRQVLEQKASADYPQLETLYQQLHANPELSLMEEKTSARFAAEL